MRKRTNTNENNGSCLAAIVITITVYHLSIMNLPVFSSPSCFAFITTIVRKTVMNNKTLSSTPSPLHAPNSSFLKLFCTALNPHLYIKRCCLCRQCRYPHHLRRRIGFHLIRLCTGRQGIQLRFQLILTDPIVLFNQSNIPILFELYRMGSTYVYCRRICLPIQGNRRCVPIIKDHALRGRAGIFDDILTGGSNNKLFSEPEAEGSSDRYCSLLLAIRVPVSLSCWFYLLLH